VVCQMGPRNDV